MDFLNRNQHFAPGLCRQIAFELVDLSALSTDDDSRTGSVNNDLEAIGSTLDVDMGNAGACETALEVTLKFQILKQELAKLFLRVPVRMPVFVVA